MNLVAARRLEVAPGALTAMKWLGLALMVVDHVDAFLYGRTLTWACALGRLVFPLFAFVLAYNLARPGMLEGGAFGRILGRLALAGAVAAVPHMLLRGAVLPVNIMATLAVAVGVIWLLELERRELAVMLGLVGGGLVEYAWPGVGLVVACWAFLRSPTVAGFGLVVLVLGSLVVVNGSHAALWALPVVLLASRLELELPRHRTLFYAFYPVHLAAFWLAVFLGVTR